MENQKNIELKQLSFWQTLKDKMDFAKSRPKILPGYEKVGFISRSGKEYFVVKSPGGEGYIRLSVKDHFMFSLLDGSRMVQEVLVEYFRKYGSLAFSRLGTLVQELVKGGFLYEKQGNFYEILLKRIKFNKPVAKLVNFIKSLPRRQWPVPNLDRHITWLYQNGFRFFYFRPVQIGVAAFSVVGFFIFSYLFRVGNYSILRSSGSVILGLILLVGLNYISIMAHELSHALACKHYGRRINSGGIIINTAFPSFYVDITDSWLLSKRKRMIVSLTGPMSQAFIAGLMSAVMLLFPHFFLNPILYKFSFLSYLAVFLNLNPLLELDGYYILIDWLEIPGLKTKATNFVKKQLFAKIKSRAPLDWQEKVFTAYGLGVAVWSLLALVIVGYFWRIRAQQIGSHFLNATNQQVRLILLLTAGVIILAGAAAAYKKIRMIAIKLWHIFTDLVYRKPAVMAGILFLLCLIGSFAYSLIQGWPATAISVVFGIGLGALFQRVYSYYKGSSLWLVLLGLLAVSLGSLTIKLFPTGIRHVIWLVGSVLLFVAIYTQFSFSSLRRWKHWQRILWGVLWLGVMLLAGKSQNMPTIRILSIMFSSSAFLMLLSLVWHNMGSSLEYFWIYFLLGVISWNAILLLSLYDFGFLTAMLLIFAVFWLYLIIKSAKWLPETAVFEAATSEKRRMRQAAVKIYKMSRSYFASFFGEGQARAMDDRLNLVMVERKWPIRLYGNGSEERFERSVGIVERSQAFQGLLNELFHYLSKEVGEYFARNTIKTAYESLYWEEREIAQQYLMKGSLWAVDMTVANLKQEKLDAKNVTAAVAKFWELTEEEAALFFSHLKEERARSGDYIIRQGEQGNKFYILKSGQVEVIISRKGESDLMAARLSRGDYFGEIALIKNVPRTASVKAVSDCSLLVLERSDFEALMSKKVDLAVRIDRLIENRGFLIKLPLFAEFAPAQVAMAASRLVPERYQPGQPVIVQGEIGDSFFIIKEGRLDVLVDKESKKTKVAELGPGEYFGEIALLLDVPRTADVVSRTECLILRLHKEDFKSLLGEQLYFAQSLERTSSRRMSDTRHKTNL
jgi:putative peptide zinc metalloprotease protein